MILFQNITNEYEQMQLELGGQVQSLSLQPRLVRRNGPIRFTTSPDDLSWEQEK